MGILKVVLFYVLTIYLVILIGRMILSWIQVFASTVGPDGDTPGHRREHLHGDRSSTEIATSLHPDRSASVV